jgi:hypothetical protein
MVWHFVEVAKKNGHDLRVMMLEYGMFYTEATSILTGRTETAD